MQVVAEPALNLAEHLRLHGVERLDRAWTPNLQIVRSIPDDGRKRPAHVLDFLEAVRSVGVSRRHRILLEHTQSVLFIIRQICESVIHLTRPQVTCLYQLVHTDKWRP